MQHTHSHVTKPNPSSQPSAPAAMERPLPPPLRDTNMCLDNEPVAAEPTPCKHEPARATPKVDLGYHDDDDVEMAGAPDSNATKGVCATLLGHHRLHPRLLCAPLRLFIMHHIVCYRNYFCSSGSDVGDMRRFLTVSHMAVWGGATGKRFLLFIHPYSSLTFLGLSWAGGCCNRPILTTEQ